MNWVVIQFAMALAVKSPLMGLKFLLPFMTKAIILVANSIKLTDF